jgi:hypothetical protein
MQDFFQTNFYNCFLWSRYGAGTGTVTCQVSVPKVGSGTVRNSYDSATLLDFSPCFAFLFLVLTVDQSYLHFFVSLGSARPAHQAVLHRSHAHCRGAPDHGPQGKDVRSIVGTN